MIWSSVTRRNRVFCSAADAAAFSISSSGGTALGTIHLFRVGSSVADDRCERQRHPVRWAVSFTAYPYMLPRSPAPARRAPAQNPVYPFIEDVPSRRVDCHPQPKKRPPGENGFHVGPRAGAPGRVAACPPVQPAGLTVGAGRNHRQDAPFVYRLPVKFCWMMMKSARSASPSPSRSASMPGKQFGAGGHQQNGTQECNHRLIEAEPLTPAAHGSCVSGPVSMTEHAGCY